MPALLNARHELFAQELANGKPAVEAHRLAGYRPLRSSASRLQHDANICERVAELLSERNEIAVRATENMACPAEATYSSDGTTRARCVPRRPRGGCRASPAPVVKPDCRARPFMTGVRR